MWCFVDESWMANPAGGRVGVLFALTVPADAIVAADEMLFAVRQKYYGRDHAKNILSELKGSSLLSNRTLALAASRTKPMPVNFCVAREVLSWCVRNRPKMRLDAFATTIYGVDPRLECLDPKGLELPFRELLMDVSLCCRRRAPDEQVTLVFDERGPAQAGIAMAIKNFVAGVGVSNMNPYPYFGVSNVVPFIQIADICAYIVSHRAIGDKRFISPLYLDVAKLQWHGRAAGTERHGFRRYDQVAPDQFKVRGSW